LGYPGNGKRKGVGGVRICQKVRRLVGEPEAGKITRKEKERALGGAPPYQISKVSNRTLRPVAFQKNHKEIGGKGEAKQTKGENEYAPKGPA